MKRSLLLLALVLTAACSAESPTPVPPTVLELPNDPPIVVKHDPVPLSLPGDCGGALRALIDTASPLAAPITRADVEQRTNPLGTRPAPVIAMLGRVSLSFLDRDANPITERPAWVLYWTGEMTSPPSGGPFIPRQPGVTLPPRPVWMSTTSMAVIDAVTGEMLAGAQCGMTRVE
jgi:hypothetical protein